MRIDNRVATLARALAHRTFPLLVILLAVAQAQSPPPVDNPASVEGVVTNSLTGEPLLRAHIVLRANVGGSTQTFGALTNAAGKFSVTGMPAGSYQAQVERVGFTAPANRIGRFGTQIELRAGDKKDDIKLQLTPCGSITGRVVDADGEPQESIMVTVEGGEMGMNSNATTDVKGQFRLGGLAPGKYRVKASPENLPLPPEIRTDGSVETYHVSTYYPNSSDPKHATRVQVQSGAEVSAVEIRLARAPIVRISGIVTGFTKGTERAMVELRKNGGFGGGRQVKPDGTFEAWRVEPGKYTVTANWRSNGQVLRTAPVDVEVAESNVDHIELRMIPPTDIAGQVDFEDEQAKQPPQFKNPPGRQPTAPPKPPPRQLILFTKTGQSPRPVPIAEDGSFRLLEVQPDRYRVRLSYGPGYVRAMRLGETSIEGNLLDLRNGSNGATLTLLVATATAEISGTVTDDKGPAAHMPVALLLDDAEGMPAFYTNSGDDGTYHFTNLAPGKYKLLPVDESDRGLLRTILEDYEDVMETVDLHDGDKPTRDLKRAARAATVK